LTISTKPASPSARPPSSPPPASRRNNPRENGFPDAN
jgi:hypothetical protein